MPSASGSTPPPPSGPSGSTPPPPSYQPGGFGGGQTPPPAGPGYGGPGYPGGPGQPPQNPGDFPGKTLGIVGLIVAIFANVVGLIISIIARNQSKRAGYKNGPATAGIVVGAVLTGIGVIVAIFSIIAIVIAGTTTAAVVGGLSDYTPSATSDPSDGGDVDETQVDVFSIQVGDCLNDTTSGTEVSDVPLVSCSDPHDYEVYYDFDITGGSTYPGDDAVAQDAEEGCADAYEAFVGIPYADSTLNYNYYTPTSTSWEEADDRLVSCVIYDPAGKVSGTLEGSKR
ncbi:septum formation family protein [Cnuibacter physcomitrellae]|uniref:DUF4190 domain-containing protein n=1 Tax=Cnuibacter physcomitrellae TaxID=1619308 RepID=UPI002175AD9E|nr:DUF4190 domain-containing protein [Cnuibacter physcomitrellae]MCS5495656.1 septum formation family protein [Cnuibacter physcomitrellae]